MVVSEPRMVFPFDGKRHLESQRNGWNNFISTISAAGCSRR
jgi:hypothetical protein